MSIPCTRGKRAFLFLVLALLVFVTTQAQKPTVVPPNAVQQQQRDPLPPKQKAVQLLRKNLRTTGLNQSMLNSYVVTDAYPDKGSGSFLVYLQQTHLGIPVYNKIGVFIFKNDTLVDKRPDFVSRLVIKSSAAAKATASIDAGRAIRFAASHLSITLRQEPNLSSASLVWLPVNDGRELKLSWNVRVVSPDGNQDWMVRVDAQTGEVLEKNSLIVSEKASQDCPAAGSVVGAAGGVAGVESFLAAAAAPPPPTATGVNYRVYPIPVESPNFGSRSLENNPWLRAGAGNNAITLGWHFDNTTNYTNTRGNNVWVQEDLSGASTTAGLSDTSSTATPTLTFDRAIDPSLSPSSYSNIRAGIDNLFYWNNLMHDISYQYGFDEPAGNFQASNLGRGGEENDFVNAFAQDGFNLNNADFNTPPDGSNPRMRMFLWNSAVAVTFHVNAPAGIAANDTAVEGGLSPNNRLADVGPVTGDIVLVDDLPATTHQGCGTIGNSAALAGKIALLDRGGCNFTVKIKNAQNAGAIAVIVGNNVPGVSGMSGYDPTITIPAVMVSSADASTLKANLTGLNATLSATGLYKDGALDNGVVSHEYTHGISNRLTGGPANTGCLANAEQMGEGWSDYVALMVTTNWATAVLTDGPNKRPLGTYVMSQAATGDGIRIHPYSTDMGADPWTYGMLATQTGGEVHAIGEIWCSAIWDMTWNIIQQEGIDPDIYHGSKGNNIALQLVLEGMKLQPCSPGFLDARNAILKADSLLYNYKHKCAIWNAFARRGMGIAAVQGSTNSYTDQTENFTLPSGVGVSQTVSKTSLAQGDNVVYTINATCDCSVLSNVSVVDTLSANLNYVSSSAGGVYTAPYVKFSGLSFNPGETKTFTVNAIAAGTYATPDTLINDTRDPAVYTWTPTLTTGGTFFVNSTARAHSPSNAWFATDLATATDFALVSGNLVLDTLSTLSFWHYYETDPAFDGGVVEITTDGGSSWKDLGPYMTQNGYNSSLDPTATGIGNRNAFTGSSGGSFIRTVASLTGFAGATAKIRFRFTSETSIGDEGWYIDDILLMNEKGAVSSANVFNSGGSLLSKSFTISPFAPVALPVNFLSFAVKKLNGTALLHWSVNEEINADEYIVQRSGDGTRFASIGELTHDPSGTSVKDYSFTDGQPLQGNNFYRIVEKDLDGQTTTSPTKLLQFNSSGFAVHLSPVPTYNHTVQLEITTDDERAVSAYLMNTVGQVVKVYSVKRGMNILSLDNLARGVYFLKIQTEIRKVVIQ